MAALLALTGLAQAQDDACLPLLVSVNLNGRAFAGAPLVFAAPDQRLYVDQEFLAQLRTARLIFPAPPPSGPCGPDLYPLDALPGLRPQLDSGSLSLSLQAPPEQFELLRLSQIPPPPAITPSPPGGFFNYAVSVQNPDRLRGAAQLELGVFNAQGSGLAAFSLYNAERAPDFVVREVGWRYDDSARRQTWRFGDFIARPGNAFRRGGFLTGVQWSSNYELQPGFSTLPPLTIRGQALLPGVVDLLREGSGGSTQFASPVPSGPFELEVQPAVSGAGNITAQITDAQGQRRLVSLPVYVEPRLLRPGLREFSFEIGAPRANLGLKNFDYGLPGIAALGRQGINEQWTLGLETELQSAAQAVGLETTYVLPEWGSFDAAASLSHAQAGSGRLAALAFRRMAEDLSLALSAEWSSAGFQSLSRLPGGPRRSLRASAGRSFARYGGGSLALVEDRFATGEASRFVLAQYGNSFRRAAWSLSHLRNTELSGDQRTTLSVSLPLGRAGESLFARQSWRREEPQLASLGYTKGAQTRRDFGVAASFTHDYATQTQTALGHLDYGNEQLDCAMDLALLRNQAPLRLGCQGGVGLLGGEWFAANTLSDSFALIRIQNGAGIRVLQDGRDLGAADERGMLIAPRVPAYLPARLALDENTVPLGAVVDKLEQTVVPAYRSGVVARYRLRSPRQGTARLLDAAGAALPPGTVVLGLTEPLFTAEDGALFWEDMPPRATLSVRLGGRECRYEVVYPASRDPLPDLGDLSCRSEPAP